MGHRRRRFDYSSFLDDLHRNVRIVLIQFPIQLKVMILMMMIMIMMIMIMIMIMILMMMIIMIIIMMMIVIVMMILMRMMMILPVDVSRLAPGGRVWDALFSHDPTRASFNSFSFVI